MADPRLKKLRDELIAAQDVNATALMVDVEALSALFAAHDAAAEAVHDLEVENEGLAEALEGVEKAEADMAKESNF